MRSPVSELPFKVVDLVDSTQNLAGQLLVAGEKVGAVLARDQIAGRGRFSRNWVSSPGDSLTVSFIFHDYPDHHAPHLLGMGVAIAVAGAIHCHLQWPNDLFEGGKKVGGILTELLLDAQGKRIAVVGVGINLNQTSFPPEIADRATSLALQHGGRYEAESVAKQIADRIALLPEPTSWAALAPAWSLFDQTPGKRYRLPSGDEAVAIGVGSDGQLLCSVSGESTSVLAADALFGSQIATPT